MFTHVDSDDESPEGMDSRPAQRSPWLTSGYGHGHFFGGFSQPWMSSNSMLEGNAFWDRRASMFGNPAPPPPPRYSDPWTVDYSVLENPSGLTEWERKWKNFVNAFRMNKAGLATQGSGQDNEPGQPQIIPLEPSNIELQEPKLIPEEPIGELVSVPNREEMGEPMRELWSEPMRELRSEPVRELMSEPVRELMSEPMRELMSEPVRELTSEPVREVTREPVRELMSISVSPPPVSTWRSGTWRRGYSTSSYTYVRDDFRDRRRDRAHDRDRRWTKPRDREHQSHEMKSNSRRQYWGSSRPAHSSLSDRKEKKNERDSGYRRRR